MGAKLSRYVVLRCATGLLIAFFVVVSLIMLVDFVETNRDLDADIAAGSAQILYLTLLKTPSLIEETIPFVVLFGMMGAIYDMNRRSELIVMRASGQSAWNIIRPALYLAAALGIIWSTAFNPLATRLDRQFETLSTEWLGSERAFVEEDIWLREGQNEEQWVIRARSIDWESQTLNDVDFIVLRVNDDGRTTFSRRYDASTARLLNSGYWQLSDVIENAPNVPAERHDTIALPTQVTLPILRERIVDEPRTGFWSLPSVISENRQAGFSTRSLRLEFNRLLSLPILLIGMTFIAAGVSMRLTREGGTLRLVITGVALGFVVFFANSLVSAFGEASVVPVTLAAWAVPIMVLLLGVAYLSLVEDG